MANLHYNLINKNLRNNIININKTYYHEKDQKQKANLECSVL